MVTSLYGAFPRVITILVNFNFQFVYTLGYLLYYEVDSLFFKGYSLVQNKQNFSSFRATPKVQKRERIAHIIRLKLDLI